MLKDAQAPRATHYRAILRTDSLKLDSGPIFRLVSVATGDQGVEEASKFNRKCFPAGRK